jgi:hypothetical protein
LCFPAVQEAVGKQMVAQDDLWPIVWEPIWKVTKAKGLEAWLKWESACLASLMPWVKNPVLSNNPKT